jgi:hypothetical protein
VLLDGAVKGSDYPYVAATTSRYGVLGQFVCLAFLFGLAYHVDLNGIGWVLARWLR